MIISQTFNDITIEAEIFKGVNLLSGNSGTGKTLLMQSIELYCANNNIKYAFLNYRNKDNTKEQIISLCQNTDIVMIDNADLFITNDIIREILEISNYIVISLKDSSKIDGRKIRECIVHYDCLKLTLEEI